MTHDRDDPFAVIEAEAVRQTAAEQAASALSAARARLILGRDARSAFFACLVLRLTPEVDWDCETMATDGRVLDYNPRFVTGLGPDELVGVLAHEVMHNALAHPGRRGLRDPTQWNVACDLAVNPLLVQAGFALPASRLMPGAGAYAHLPPGRSADEYYALLGPVHPPTPSDDTRTGDGDGEQRPGDPGGCGSVTDPAGASLGQVEQEPLVGAHLPPHPAAARQAEQPDLAPAGGGPVGPQLLQELHHRFRVVARHPLQLGHAILWVRGSSDARGVRCVPAGRHRRPAHIAARAGPWGRSCSSE
ncbi:MAG TPA: hypothetical protein VM597_17560 [Gemmataceae bacterium]|nr:hypothetical protein [Gemmataceae bacterium]